MIEGRALVMLDTGNGQACGECGACISIDTARSDLHWHICHDHAITAPMKPCACIIVCTLHPALASIIYYIFHI